MLGLLALFTHMHIFWIAGLLLAMIDLPDFGSPLSRIAGSAEKIAGFEPGEGAVERAARQSTRRTGRRSAKVPPQTDAARQGDAVSCRKTRARSGEQKELIHA